jgi:hypothetical protein
MPTLPPDPYGYHHGAGGKRPYEISSSVDVAEAPTEREVHEADTETHRYELAG